MKAALFFIVALMTFVEGHIRRDRWMIHNDIDPDFMHYLAKRSASKGARVMHRL